MLVVIGEPVIYPVLQRPGYWMDADPSCARQSRPVARYRKNDLTSSPQTRHVVTFTIHWHIISVETIKPGADAALGLASSLARLAANGWHAECTPEFGFVFVRRGDDRMLVIVTGRDPNSDVAPSFSPFRDR